MQNPFTVSKMRPIRDGMTVSRDAKLGEKNRVSWFSLGAGTDISRERYDRPSTSAPKGRASFCSARTRAESRLRRTSCSSSPAARSAALTARTAWFILKLSQKRRFS